MTLKLLIDNDRNMVSRYPVIAFQDAIRASGRAQVVPNRYLNLGKLLNRLLLFAYQKFGARKYLPCLPGVRHSGYFSISVGPHFAKCLPHFLTAENNSVYLMDACPNWYDLVDFFIRALNIRLVFLSSDQATQAFRKRHHDIAFIWLPEAVNPQTYYSAPYAEKHIDVLQFGRKYDIYHERILAQLQASDRVYLYEKSKGELVFPSRADFVAGLSRTKVSICFPSSITHPERAGTISTMTTRYLQSMAAKCLVVGMTPSDMRPLFDHDPIIQADMDDPYGQLDEILGHFADYVPLIEKNYEAVCNHHTWAHRWQQVQAAIS